MKKEKIRLKKYTDLVLKTKSMTDLPHTDIECDAEGWTYLYGKTEDCSGKITKNIISLMRLYQLIFAVTKDKELFNRLLSELQDSLNKIIQYIEQDKIEEKENDKTGRK